MINFFEKHSWLSWLITFIIAAVIFYLSSLSFKPGVFSEYKTFSYHFLIFFFFSFFLLISIIKGKNKNLLLITILIAIMYAVLDEFHQLFIPGRSCSFSDFLIDLAGILIASLIYSLVIYFRKYHN